MAVSISVIISAHNRREFLLEAVNSVIHQTIPRDTYEIIVSKNFVDPSIDEYLIAQNVKIIDSGGVHQGEQLYGAITLAEGRIIALLDYDDLFTERKLELVKYYFDSNPNIIYLHNQYKVMRNGSLNETNVYKSLKETVITSGLEIKTVKKYLKYGIWSNNSSISFKKEFLVKYSNSLRSIQSRIDFFVFYTALMNGGNLVFSTEYLSIYRIHESESHISSLDTLKNHRTLLYTRWRDVDLLLLSICKIDQIREIIGIDLLMTRLNLKILGADSAIKLNELRYLLKYFMLHRNIYPFVILFFYLISIFSISLSTSTMVTLLSVYYKDFY